MFMVFNDYFFFFLIKFKSLKKKKVLNDKEPFFNNVLLNKTHLFIYLVKHVLNAVLPYCSY